MFIVKFFDKDGSYTAFSCLSYRVLPPKDGPASIQLFGVGNETQCDPIPIEDKAIIENEKGTTVDVIRAKRGG